MLRRRLLTRPRPQGRAARAPGSAVIPKFLSTQARVEVRLIDLAHSLKKAFRPPARVGLEAQRDCPKIFKWAMTMLLNYALAWHIIL